MAVDQRKAAVKAQDSDRMRIARCAAASVHIEASPSTVWQIVADLDRQPDWSCEATRCEWISPADRAASGARFRGHNRRGFRRWSRDNEVTDVEPGRVLGWRTLPSRLYPDSTDWRIEIRPDGDGSEVRESYEIRSISRGFEVFMYWFNPRHRERSVDLDGDLRRLKACVEEAVRAAAGP
jgi:uncharacterized protein YndB with AHSA1/START domain